MEKGGGGAFHPFAYNEDSFCPFTTQTDKSVKGGKDRGDGAGQYLVVSAVGV